MKATNLATMTPAREDASHAPPFAIRPLPLRAWPTRADNVNDNQVADVYGDALIRPQPEPQFPEAQEPPIIEHTESAPPRRFSVQNAAYGLVGAASLVIALFCLLAR